VVGRFYGLGLALVCALVVVDGAGAQRVVIRSSPVMSIAHAGQLVPLPEVSPPAKIATRQMRWSRERPTGRVPAATRYADGRAVIGIAPGIESLDLGSGVSIVNFDAGLHAAEVSGSPTALAALESRVTLQGPLRYVEPIKQQFEQHDRLDPATYTLDPLTGAPYEWAFSHVGMDRALNLSQGDSQILVGIVDSGWSQIPEIQSKVAESWYYSSEGTDALDTVGHGTFVASIHRGIERRWLWPRRVLRCLPHPPVPRCELIQLRGGRSDPQTRGRTRSHHQHKPRWGSVIRGA
jgi:hypothetical protein